MPLVRIDAIAGRTDLEISKLQDAIHRTVVSAFGVPERDYYQIYHEHPPAHMVIQDTGLGIERTKNVLVICIRSTPRDDEKKFTLYRELVHELEATCGILRSDVMVSIVSNTRADWSFGNGEAQFITGAL